jgi:hypothetical protein
MPIEISFKIAPKKPRRPDQLVARGAFKNTETTDTSFNATAVSAPSLALEVRGPAGEVSLGPPPVPPTNDVRVTLAPKKKYPVKFARFLPDPMPKGRYEIRLRYRDITADIHSDWKAFHIG